MVMIRFKSGTLCTIDNHRYAQYGYDQRVEVFTDDGLVKTGNESLSVTTKITATSNLSDAPKAGMDRYHEAYGAGIQHFLEALGKEPSDDSFRVGLNDCVLGSAIADACKQSMETGKRVTLVTNGV